MGITRGASVELFGAPPPRRGKGGIVEGGWDFAATDLLTPHPVYGWTTWVAILAPFRAIWAKTCAGLVADAHGRAKSAFEKRTR